MLTREDDVDVHKLHAKGWTISAIARRRQTMLAVGLGRASVDAGYLPLASEAAAALFQVITQRYLNSSTVLTTNLGIAA